MIVKVKFNNTASSPAGCFQAGKTYKMHSGYATKYIASGDAICVDDDIQKRWEELIESGDDHLTDDDINLKKLCRFDVRYSDKDYKNYPQWLEEVGDEDFQGHPINTSEQWAEIEADYQEEQLEKQDELDQDTKDNIEWMDKVEQDVENEYMQKLSDNNYESAIAQPETETAVIEQTVTTKTLATKTCSDCGGRAWGRGYKHKTKCKRKAK